MTDPERDRIMGVLAQAVLLEARATLIPLAPANMATGLAITVIATFTRPLGPDEAAPADGPAGSTRRTHVGITSTASRERMIELLAVADAAARKGG